MHFLWGRGHFYICSGSEENNLTALMFLQHTWALQWQPHQLHVHVQLGFWSTCYFEMTCFPKLHHKAEMINGSKSDKRIWPACYSLPVSIMLWWNGYSVRKTRRRRPDVGHFQGHPSREVSSNRVHHKYKDMKVIPFYRLNSNIGSFTFLLLDFGEFYLLHIISHF